MFVPAISMAFCTLSFVLWHFGQFLPFLVWEVVIVESMDLQGLVMYIDVLVGTLVNICYSYL